MLKEDIDMIQGIVNRGPVIEKNFYTRYKAKIMGMAINVFKNSKDAEDKTQIIFDRLFAKLRKNPRIENLDAWVITVAVNICRDEYRKLKREGLNKTRSYNESTDKDLLFNTKQSTNISLEYIESVNISLEYIERLYRLKKNLKKPKPIINVYSILRGTKEKFYYTFGKQIEKKINKHNELEEKDRSGEDLSEQEKKEIFNLKTDKNRVAWAYFTEIDKLLKEATKDRNIRFAYDVYLIWALDLNFPEDIYINLFQMRIKPPRLIYMIWSKAEELKRGNRVNNKGIEFLFKSLKKESQGSEREFLFKSIKIKDDKVQNFEAIRKSKYKDFKNERFLEKLVENIYKRSFIDKLSPKDEQKILVKISN